MLLQLLLQEVAWEEDSRGRMRAERAAVVAQYEDIGDLQHEPFFCAETALKVAMHGYALSGLHVAQAAGARRLFPTLCRTLCDTGTCPDERRATSTTW